MLGWLDSTTRIKAIQLLSTRNRTIFIVLILIALTIDFQNFIFGIDGSKFNSLIRPKQSVNMN
ncbi:hypothetical protein BLOT_009290 [Blomia tropicalis]|nr:hypothetical protein BLOT_009290 [Blomia tropicalis]